MAIVTFRNYKSGQTRGCMSAVMKYTKRKEKVEWEDKQLVTGINCRPDTVYEDFLRTKQLYHKEGGVLFYHMVQSFPKGADVDPKTAHAAAVELAEYFKNHEVLVCTHTDREHVHSHFIINSVNFETGKKLHMADQQIQELRQRNDIVCEQFRLPVFEPQQEWKNVPKRKPKPMTIGEYHVAAKGQSWKFRLMATIDECMEYAKTRDEFITLMRSEGYDVKWTDTRKYITYTTPDGDRCRDNKLHEEKYLKENMEYEFKIRQGILEGVHDGRAEEYESPRPDGGGRVRNARHADREELVGGGESAGAIVYDAPADHGAARNAADETGRRKSARTDRALDADAALSVESNDGAIRTAGGGDERKVRLRRERFGAEHREVAPLDERFDRENPARDDKRNARTDQRAGRLSKVVVDAAGDRLAPAAARAWNHLRDRDVEEIKITETGWEKEREAFLECLASGQCRLPLHMADTRAERRNLFGIEQQARPVGYAPANAPKRIAGQVAKTLMHAERILDDESEDAEELRRKIEAQESAQNVGALVGIAAGVALGIADKHKQSETSQVEATLENPPYSTPTQPSAEPQQNQQPMEQSM